MDTPPRRAPGLRLSRLLLALLATSLLFVLANVYVVRSIQDDAAWVNVAGRRRMQSYEVLYLARRAVAEGAASPVRQRLGDAVIDLDRQLVALRQTEAERDLLAPGDPEVGARLGVLEQDWHQQLRPLMLLIAGGRSPAEAAAALDRLDPAIVRHVALVDDLVSGFERLSSDHFARIQILLRILFGMMVATLAVLLWLLRDVNRRIRVLAAAAEHLAAGEAGYRLRVEGDDDLGALGSAFNEMAARRQKAEEDRRQSQERFALFMGQLPGVAFIKDLEGRMVYVNPRFEEEFGRDWQGKGDAELWPPDVGERLRQADRQVIERRTVLQTVETVPSRGTERHWLVSKFPIPGSTGEPVLLGGVAIDITDRRRAEVALEESAARYQAIVDLALDAVITINEQAIIESFNPAAERIFGYRAAEVLGRNVQMLMPSPYREEHDRYLASYIETGKAKIIGIGREVVGQRRDGTLFPLDLAVSEIRLADRRIFTGTARDLTQRRRAEVLAQMGVLASGLAHEIGTPMNVILGRAEFVRSQLKDPQSARHLDVIIEQVERIARLIQQLLVLTRPHPLERRSTDLNQVVASTVEVIQERLRKRHIALELGLDPALPPAELDPDRMGQLVLNLVVNAIDAMESREGTLRVATSAYRPPGGGADPVQVELSVADSGCGISGEHLVQIFTPFFTTKDPGRGTGLGLSVVQGIVRDHGGEILVESEVGRGTTFRIRLPLTAAQARSRGTIVTDMRLRDE